MRHKNKKYLLPILALVVANALWGVTTILAKISLETIPPAVHTGLRFVLISLVLLPFALRGWKKLKKSEVLRFFMVSFSIITLSAFAFNVGLSQTAAYNVAVIWLAGPVILMLLSVAFLKEKLTTRVFVGISIALAGSVLIIGLPTQEASGGGSLTGNLLIALSVIFNAVGILLSKPLTKKFGAFQTSFMTIFPGAIPLVIIGMTQLSEWSAPFADTGALVAMGVGVILAVVANSLFYWGLRRKAVNGAGIYLYVDPAVTIFCGWLIFGEHPSIWLAMGAGLVIVGIYVAEIHTRKHRHHIVHHSKRH